jgi:hypothetical protein
MMTDAQNLFADALAITATGLATNVIDLGAVREIGQGEPMGVAILVDVAADAGNGDETYAFGIETDDNAALSSPTVSATRTIARADLTAGSLHVIPISPAEAIAFQRYLGVRATLGGTTPSITYTAWLTPLNMVAGRAKVYPDGFTISA